jgi:hypothetical protein
MAGRRRGHGEEGRRVLPDRAPAARSRAAIVSNAGEHPRPRSSVSFADRNSIGDLPVDRRPLRVMPKATHSASPPQVFQQLLLQGSTRLNELTR